MGQPLFSLQSHVPELQEVAVLRASLAVTLSAAQSVNWTITLSHWWTVCLPAQFLTDLTYL